MHKTAALVILGPIGFLEFLFRLVIMALVVVTLIGLIMIAENVFDIDDILVPKAWDIMMEIVNG